MATSRNLVGYHLLRRGEVVYVGITIDPDRRKAEHKREGTNGHDDFKIVKSGLTEAQAIAWEQEQKRNGIPITRN